MTFLSGWLAVMLAAAQPSSDNYTIETWSMDSGSRSIARSASYNASMTIGQPDASPRLTSSSYSFIGGIHGLLAPPDPLSEPLFRDGFEDAATEKTSEQRP